jgi:hypothetical protein
MPCGSCTANNEAKTARKKKGGKKRKKAAGSRTGPKVRVSIGGRTFMAHKKQGTEAGRRKLREKNPKLYFRSQAAKQVAQEMRSEGRPMHGITDPAFKSRVAKRYKELLSSNGL